MRNTRRTLTGVVTSNKMDKTITVAVTSYKVHSLYGKRVKQTSKFKAHDELNKAKIGDEVIIAETRPLSATKRFRLLEITKEAVVV